MCSEVADSREKLSSFDQRGKGKKLKEHEQDHLSRKFTAEYCKTGELLVEHNEEIGFLVASSSINGSMGGRTSMSFATKKS